MSPDAQRIAIAEACPEVAARWECMDTLMNPARFDPLTDLNAMHAVEETLDLNQEYTYGETLARMVQKEEIEAEKRIGLRRKSNNTLYKPNGWGWLAIAHATAAQRAEAFLRTLGKWVD